MRSGGRCKNECDGHPHLHWHFTTVFLLRGARGSILVDTGYPGQADLILARLAEHGVSPHDVRLILLTHGHIDHFGSAAELRERTGAPVAIHTLDVEAARQGINPLETLRPTNWIVALAMRIPRVVGPDRAPAFEPDIVFEEEWRLDEYTSAPSATLRTGSLSANGVAGRVLPTPGHTPGSVSVLLDSGEAIVGDVVIGDFLRLLRRPGLPIVAWDLERNWESVRQLLALSPRLVSVGHGGPFEDLSDLVKKQWKGNGAMKIEQTIAIGLGGLALAAAGGLAVRFHLGRRRADRVWAAARYPKLKDMGAVKHLTILPLVDWYTARDPSTGDSTGSPRSSGQALVGELGVSYLVRADDTTILFDVGLNQRGEHPSPLLRNMQALGVTLEEVDYIVISHLHLDHVGGMEYQRKRTFALSGKPLNLGGMTVLVPEPMTHPTARVEVVEGPRVIAPGVASIGPIPRQLFFFGWTPEQSLAVNVEGKGIVLITGCGHPTLQRIVELAEMLFDEPIYGIIGGLHYPVTASRGVRFRLPVQRILGTGKWPWDPISKEDVEASIAYLQRRHPQLVALSPHDSCDWSIEVFRRAFDGAYQDVLVGGEIVVQ